MSRDAYWLSVYRAESGQWAGQVFKGQDLVCGIAGLASSDQVEEEAYEQFPDIDEVMFGQRPA